MAGLVWPGMGLIFVMVPLPHGLGVNGRHNLLKKHCNCNLYRQILLNRKRFLKTASGLNGTLFSRAFRQAYHTTVTDQVKTEAEKSSPGKFIMP